jgi:hypothetical protein
MSNQGHSEMSNLCKCVSVPHKPCKCRGRKILPKSSNDQTALPDRNPTRKHMKQKPFFAAPLQDTDPRIAKALEQELGRQQGPLREPVQAFTSRSPLYGNH